ncbi:retention module-containing protein [Aeromonas veronii]|uniref:retention module-containing protein n=4 Tax=Aeromonas veronii TaxID=654 RepID=UPI00211D85DD|nr:retention module-containing protein [Aeromonas veronii]UUM70457.1 retention module-containing protein [Aeromonas veronii]
MRTQIIDKSVVVSAIEGNVEIVLADGSSRPLQKGEILQPGAKLAIVDDAKLALSPYDDTPAQNSASGSESVELGQPQGASPTEGAPADIAALQQSILQGVDPTQNFEASAAGGAPAAGGGGGIGGVAGASGNGGFVTIDRTGDATIAEAGFDTTYDTGVVINENQAEDLILENQLDDLGETAVTQEDTQVSGNLLDNSTNPDGPADASIVSYDWGINIGVPAGVAATITGVGTLIINPDGSYTFTPAPNYDGTVPPVNYQVTDGQDTVTSTLVISITPVDEEVSLDGLTQEGGEVLVSDANLADGSTPDAAALTQGGAFTFNAPDGVQTLAIGVIQLISNGTVVALPLSIETPLGNALQITAITYDPVTGNGSVSYSYTLADNEVHQQPAFDLQLGESLTVTLTDDDGDTTSATLDIVVLDDVPVLQQEGGSDTVDVDEDDLQASRGKGESEGNDAGEREPLSVTGSIVDNVAWGADGFGKVTGVSWSGGMATIDEGQTSVAVYFDANGAVQAEATGAAASLQVDADGSYTFTLADNLLVSGDAENIVKLLTDGFTFAAQDGDGDPVVGGIKVNVNITDDVPVLKQTGGSDTVDVDEDDLQASRGKGESEGNDAGEREPLSVTGSIVDNVAWGADGFGKVTGVSWSGGMATIDEGQTSVAVYFDANGAVQAEATGAAASLQVDADGSYTFTLADNLLVSGDAENIVKLLTDGFTFAAQDGDGDPVVGGIKVNVNITDDVPVLKQTGGSDTVDVDEDDLQASRGKGESEGNDAGEREPLSVTGSIVDNVAWGADGFGKVTGVSWSGGMATIDEGQTSVAVYFDANGAVQAEATGAAASLQVDADGSYTFTLADNLLVSGDAENIVKLLTDGFTFAAQDGDGDPVVGGIKVNVNITDDVPVLKQTGGSDTVDVDEDDLQASRGKGESEGNDAGEREPLSVTGSIVDNVAWGADGFGKVTGVSWSGGMATIDEGQTSVAVYFDANGAVQAEATGAAASLQVDADGSYTFTLADNLLVSGDAENIVKLLTDGFTFAAQDGDGDPVVGGIKVNVNITDDVPVLKQTGGSDTVDVDEDDLQASRGKGESEGNDAGEREPLSVTGSIVDNVAWGADGFGKVTGVSWSGGMATIDEGQTSVAVYFDANGAVQAEATGAAASLQVDADGSYTFTLADNLLVSGDAENIVKLLTDGFTFAAQDGDGDPVVGGIKVNVNITDDVPVLKQTGGSDTVDVDEDDLQASRGKGESEGNDAGEREPLSVTGSIVDNVAWGADGFGKVTGVSWSGGMATIDEGQTSVAVYFDANGAVQAEATGAAASLQVDADGSYTFTLADNLLVSGDAENIVKLLTDGFTFAAQDGDGDPVVGGIKVNVNITDDVPVLKQTGGSDTVDVDEDDLQASRGKGESEGNDAGEREPLSVTGSIVDNVAWGADGFGKVTGVSWSGGMATIDEGQTSVAVYFDANGAVQAEATGAAASLQVDADGSYTFTLADNLLVSGDAENIVKLLTDGFTFAAQDGDGDPVVGGIKVNVNITDDVPVLKQTGGSDTVDVDEDDLQASRGKGESEGNDAGEREPLSVTGSIVDNVAWGADGFGKVTGVSWSGGMATIDEGQTSVAVYFDANGAVQAEATGAAASLQVDADGSYTFTLADNLLVSGDAENIVKLLTDGFTFAAQDGDGDPVVGGIKVNVNITDDVPVLKQTGGSDTVDVDEDDLQASRGKGESEGNDAGEREPLSVTGSIVDNVAWGADGFGKVTGVSWSGGMATIDEGQTSVAVYFDANGAVQAEATGAAASLQVDADGSYTFTLADNLLVSGDAENIVKLLTDGFTFAAQDGDGDPVVGGIKVNVNITDDVPVAVNDGPACIIQSPLPLVNVTLVLDTSGSMKGDKLAALKAAVANLVQAYAGLDAPIHVNLVTFATGSSNVGDYNFNSVSDSGYINLISAVNALSADGWTNYAEALNTAKAQILLDVNNVGADKAQQNKLYFISDGNPEPDPTGQVSAITAWQTFITNGNVDNDNNSETNPFQAHAIGINVNTGTYLNPISSSGTYILASPENLSATLVDLASAGGGVIGNVLANDNSGADGVGLIASVSVGAQTFTLNASGTDIDILGTGGVTHSFDKDTKVLSLNTELGILKIDLQGTHVGEYSFVAKANLSPAIFGDDGAVKQLFTYTLVDGDGDKAPANLEICIRSNQSVLVVGHNVSDIDSSLVAHHIASPFDSVTGGVIQGVAGNDVLIGDVGGSTRLPGQKANIVYVLDNSGSMDSTIPFTNIQGVTTNISRLDALKQSVIASLNNLYESGASDIKVHLVKFGTNAPVGSTFTLTANGTDNLEQLNSAIAFVNAIMANGGYTNYEAGLVQANNWIQSSAPVLAADVNKVLFVSDGAPNRALDNSGSVISANAQTAIKHVLGTAGNNDNVSEVGLIETAGPGTAQAFTIEAVGINVSASAQALLNDVEGSGGLADNVITANQLMGIIGNIAGGLINVAVVGNDALRGGDGNDILFGDSIYADSIDGGWASFAAAHPGATDSELRALIAAGHISFGQDGSVGGNDLLDGGAGDDTLYGQKGDDLLIGGAGSDTLRGGSGKDTFRWMAGDADGGIDRITDFAKGSDGDILDISAVLDVSTGASANTLATYLNFTFDSANNRTVLTIDSNGLTGGSQVNQTVYFDGVDLTGGSINQEAIINSLLVNLKVDD